MKKLFKKIFHRKGHIQIYHHEFHAFRDWMYVLGFFVGGFVILAVLHTMLFLNITSTDSAGEGIASFIAEKTINRTDMKKVIDRLDARQELFTSMQTSAPALVDPSR